MSILFVSMIIFAIILVQIVGIRCSPITNPLKSDADIGNVLPDYFDSKRTKQYHALTPNSTITAQEVFSRSNFESDMEFRLRWSTTVGSPVYSTPIAFPSATDGSKQIFVSTFYQYVELLDKDGFKSWGWPLSFEDSSFQGSPMVYDVDGDGNIDMGAVDKNGNMFWVRIGEFGEYLEDYHVQVPKLRVKRDWSEGLDPQFVDSYVKLSMFDRSGASESTGKDAANKARLDDLQTLGPVKSAPASSKSGSSGSRRRLSEEETVPDFGEGAVDDFMRNEAERYSIRFYSSFDESRLNPTELGSLYRLDTIHGDFYGAGGEEKEADEGGKGEAAASLDEIMNMDSKERGLDEGAAVSSGLEDTGDANAYEAEYAYRAPPGRTRGAHRSGYGASAYYGGGGVGDFNQSEYVLVDAHVLASPVLADINGDGHMEVRTLHLHARNDWCLYALLYFQYNANCDIGARVGVVLLRQGGLRRQGAGL